MSLKPKAGILEIHPYVPGKFAAAGFAAPLKLSANENALGCSDAARAAYIASADEIALYPDSRTSRLRAAVARRFGLEPERLAFGAGSDELFAMACQAFLGEGDTMVQPHYAFAAWAIAARAVGGLVKSAPERDYHVDVDAMLAAVDERTRVMFVANPANPTGTCLPFPEIERLHAALPDHVLLVLDGAYAECALDWDQYSDGLAWARDKANVLVTRTFSKIYGLASLRVGWGYGSPDVIAAMDRIRLPFSVTRSGEAAAIAALEDEDFVARSLALVRDGRARIEALAQELGFEPIPSRANFVTLRARDDRPMNAAEIEQGLATRGVLVRGLKNYGMSDCVRISVGTAEQLDVLEAALRAVVRS